MTNHPTPTEQAFDRWRVYAMEKGEKHGYTYGTGEITQYTLFYRLTWEPEEKDCAAEGDNAPKLRDNGEGFSESPEIAEDRIIGAARRELIRRGYDVKALHEMWEWHPNDNPPTKQEKPTEMVIIRTGESGRLIESFFSGPTLLAAFLDAVKATDDDK